MLRTLFLIPHQIAGLPVFGFGWLLIAIVLLLLLRLVWFASSQRNGEASTSQTGRSAALAEFIQAEGMMWLVVTAMVVFVLPQMELTDTAGQPVGIAVRGYGAFLMLAAISSVGLAAWRAGRTPGLTSDSILQLAPWTFIGGLVGARLFYVIQYWDEFMRPTWGETLASLAAFTQGGLVVYGGFIGGFVASWFAVKRSGASLWKLGDVIVPCIFIGLLFGRLGCLMNGCCFGGACEPGPLATTFPPGSPVYIEQLLSGELAGIDGTSLDDLKANTHPGQSNLKVTSVALDSLADQAGVKAGDQVRLALDFTFRDSSLPGEPAENALPGLVIGRNGLVLARLSPSQLPGRAQPVLATQVISAIAAAVMFIFLLILEWGLHKRVGTPSGVLMLLGFIAYALLRIGLEWVRVDEAGQFGTAFSISQWVSLGVILVCFITLWMRTRSTNADTRFSPTSSPNSSTT